MVRLLEICSNSRFLCLRYTESISNYDFFMTVSAITDPQNEMLRQPTLLKCGPAMNCRRPVTPADDAAHGDDRDVDEEMFAIACVPGVGERFEVTADGTDINELRHERHP